ncbi:SDR family oxidoreductase [Amycolatopsis acidiphila]|uniref:SDR family oxidoreductase n=1 Tax=Amycolatopsis acidiphila TaxID=715473 RepID=A0A558A1J0_9PSEU|nr:SDR family oxidoreductase [Amycolatopsis acidiphila]TVT18128.1 SDR family oxidoreductase [Amycolatopsis acidiphila]UIJ61937.1 SDR family oxidoreductase [Amycolatopsis acidiphila]GHG57051.1 short-chain dehydrogenase [Amycolatopsis acidiphila]
MNARLAGRTALVTGSTDGIGVGIAQALAAEGANVVVSGRNAERGAQVVKSIADKGGQARFVAADLGDGEGARALAEAAGPVDVLVNNAALLIMPQPTGEVAEELVDRALATNIKAAFLLTGLIAPAMAARGGGAIVNLGSVNGFNGSAQSALYSMTKAAVHSLTKSWAAEYGPGGVRVNTVAPGPTRTPRNAGVMDHIEPLIARTPSRRMGTPEEVGAAVVFLASDEAANIHGATLSVDGGLAAV